ncbi:MAG TPA: hypothetical protein VGS28_02450 [Candidatus Saccharimonadales bacterium]|nr:hypothetical protein [Candidatus Saccharimonadales bacterium]
MAKASLALTHNDSLARWLLRVGLAFVFVYAAVSSLIHPLVWVGYLPNLITNHLDGTLILKLIAIYQLLLAVWLMSGRYVRYAALLGALTLAGIVISNPGQTLVTFRDVGLICMALGLAVIEK